MTRRIEGMSCYIGILTGKFEGCCRSKIEDTLKGAARSAKAQRGCCRFSGCDKSI